MENEDKIHGDIDFKLVVFDTLKGIMISAREGKPISEGVISLYSVVKPVVEHRLEQKKDYAQTFTKRWNGLNQQYRKYRETGRGLTLRQYRYKQLSALIYFIERDGWLFHTRKSYSLDEVEDYDEV